MDISLRPTVVIGFGTSGARIIDKIQQEMYEVFKVNCLPSVRFISIETDKRYVVEGTPQGSDVHLLRLSSGGYGDFDNFNHLLEQLSRQGIVPDWIGPEMAQKLIAQGDGAGGARLAGRLLLWANMKDVYHAIETAQREASKPSAIDASIDLLTPLLGGTPPSIRERPMAIVCGTSTGGSFSGAFIDLGYICQKALNIPEMDTNSLFSLLLLPPEQPKENPEQLKANTYGTLMEYDYFAQGSNKYHVTWPGVKIEVSRVSRPYAYTYFISQEYGEGSNPISSLDGLYQLAALKLFIDLIGLEGKRVGRLIDHFTHGRGEKLTFGLAAIMHPRYQISEYAACEAGEALSARWLNEQQYIDQAGRENPVPQAADLTGRVRELWEGTATNNFGGLLQQRLAEFDARESGLESLQRKAENDAQRIVEDPHYDITHGFLEPGDTYYGIIQLKREEITKTLVEELEDSIWETLERTQNLTYTTSYAKSIRKVIAETLQFWENQGIPHTNSQWNTRVTQYHVPRVERAGRRTGRIFRNLMVRLDLCLGLILEAVEELKIHLLIPQLQEVQEALDKLIEDRLLRYRYMLEQAKNRLEKRKREVRSELTDDTLPIARVWSKGNMEKDLEALTVERPSAKDLAAEDYDLPRQTQWLKTTFQDWYDNDTRDRNLNATGKKSSEAIKQAYQRKVLDAIGKSLPIDLTKANYQAHVTRFFRKVQRGHLKYDNLGDPTVVNKYLIGRSDYTQEILPEVNKILQEDMDPKRNSLELPGMDHMLLYYIEEAFADNEQIRDYENMRRCYESPPLTKVKDEIKKIWKDLRIAYNVPKILQTSRAVSTREKNVERLAELFQLVSDFFVIWIKQGEQWQPISNRPEVDLPLNVGTQSGGPRGLVVPKWTVEAQLRVAHPYDLIDAAGRPNAESIKAIAADPLMVNKVLMDGVAAVRDLGAEQIIDLWEHAKPLSVKQYLTDRYGSAQALELSRHYLGSTPSIGTGQLQGLIGDILNGTWYEHSREVTTP